MEDYIAAHKKSTYNKVTLAKSKVAACFYCLRRFAPIDITGWIYCGETALCPHCEIDAVIGDATGYPIEDDAFLARMHAYWFSTGPAR